MKDFQHIVFFTGAGLSIDNGAETIEINPEETPISALFKRRIRTSASLALKELFPEYNKQ